MITQDYLKKILDYDPDTGVFKWKRHSGRTKTGTSNHAGTRTSKGYIYIKIDGVGYMAHILAWLWVYGELPSSLLDHKNEKKDDNRIENLQPLTNSENLKKSFSMKPRL